MPTCLPTGVPRPHLMSGLTHSSGSADTLPQGWSTSAAKASFTEIWLQETFSSQKRGSVRYCTLGTQILAVTLSNIVPESKQIADFGMSRDLDDDTYYISQGGKIPVKWTAPEVSHCSSWSEFEYLW